MEMEEAPGNHQIIYTNFLMGSAGKNTLILLVRGQENPWNLASAKLVDTVK